MARGCGRARHLILYPRSDWFGSFRMFGNGWGMHQDLGWFHTAKSTNPGLWIWKKGMGWLWTDQGVYPFVFSSDNADWLFFQGQRQGLKLFFDYQSKTWITLPND